MSRPTVVCHYPYAYFIYKKTFKINKSSVLLLDTILTIFNNTYFNIPINNYQADLH